MDISIFYSWQSQYRKYCDNFISSALEKAIKELNREQEIYTYSLERGGGDVLGVENIDSNIDKVIKTKANIAIVDFTHIGNVPQKHPVTGEWIKEKCIPNTNVSYETGKLENELGSRQVFRVYNTAYGDLKINLEMPFDLRQQHYPIGFYYTDDVDEEQRRKILESLKKDIKKLIGECTKEYMTNLKVRYSPLVPLHNEYSKLLWKSEFKNTPIFDIIYDKIKNGDSFRLLGLPGLGKTRIIGEAFRGRDHDAYYCDCSVQNQTEILQAFEKLMACHISKRQTVILDNCSQRLNNYVTESINENGYNCQLISIYYDPKENLDTGVDGIVLKVGDVKGVVESMVDLVSDMSSETRDTIIDLSGGFPLMAQVMIDNYLNGRPVVNVSKQEVFERMLGINSQIPHEQDVLKVLTAFSVFKFIGLYGPQEKHGRFIAGNRIVTNIRGADDDNLQLFKEVYALYSKKEILERQGNLVLMRLIPLAIFLCKSWFDKQTTDSITDLIDQIRNYQDEGVRNMLIESLSRRITLLAEIPLAKELNDGLTDPDKSPFLSEEVVLSSMGSRLFLAFSEVNPEACALALRRIILPKTDAEIKALQPARRNLAWALDHLAFDKNSFRDAMWALARMSKVETEERLSNNTTGLFVDRFSVLLSGTEANLSTRIELIKELLSNHSYDALVIKALCRALEIGHFHRSGGAEKMGTKTLVDYQPLTFKEVNQYLHSCFEMLLMLLNNQQDVEFVAKVLVTNSRNYYLQGFETFLIRVIEEISTRKGYVWEEMNDALGYILHYDAPKRNNSNVSDIEALKMKLTRDDYVYRLVNIPKKINRQGQYSIDEEQKQIRALYDQLAKEFIEQELYSKKSIVAGIMSEKCFYYNYYGMALSSYSKEYGVQRDVLEIILNTVLSDDVSCEAEELFLHYLINVDDQALLENVCNRVLQSSKKRLIVAIYAIKSLGKDGISQLFNMLEKSDISINDFSQYFTHGLLNDQDFKHLANELLNYGPEGARLLLIHCHNVLFHTRNLDEEYKDIARRCLMQVDLSTIQAEEYIYFRGLQDFLINAYDEELALHIHSILERFLISENHRTTYYLGRLYRKILQKYLNVLKPRLFALLNNDNILHSLIEFLQTQYSQEKGEDSPIFSVIASENWFDWLNEANTTHRAYVLAMLFNYSESGEAAPDMIRLINGYWCDDVRSAISARMHSYSWVGTGIPLYESRITLCKDYIAKLINNDAIDWFQQDILNWKKEIEREHLQNAHERAIYN